MPRRPMSVSGDVVVAATPMHLYELISDPSQMPRWSPENTGAVVESPVAVGTEFVGTNTRGSMSWEYRFTPVEGGTLVTETWTDDRRRWPDVVAAAFDRVATGGTTFAAFQERNIRRTLDRLKADVES